MKYNFKPSELTKEKHLWDVYLLYRRVKPSPFNVCVVLAVYALLLANSFCLEKDVAVLLNAVRNWASMGFNFAITTLGFLIAGFTIFATLGKPEMYLTMMDHTNKETGLPTLKYNFVLFMGVFIAYIFFAFAYASVMFFGQKGGLFSNMLRLSGMGAPAIEYIIKVSYSLTGASVVFLLLLLKTFVFNIYSIVMNSLRWEHLELNGKD